jgi:mannose-1-phosphate guanylyltransferase/mannose-1-phosphate guanylyltransferase/mannose-6-phosphate isomerase
MGKAEKESRLADINLITPVILSGGSGTRLWPMSTPQRPKQFLPLTDTLTMFQLTARRTENAEKFAPPLIVASARHAELIAQQLADIGIKPGAIILEPCARNTAPAIALAALETGQSPMLVMPSDHVIADEAAFMRAIGSALPLLDDGWLVTFGITPTGPETGYGYIQSGTSLTDGIRRVARFVEKPDRAHAEDMIATADHFWNGGIFLFRADMYVNALAAHAPDMLAAVQASLASATRASERIQPDEATFAACPSDSIDYAVMEKAKHVAVVPVSMGWSDVGSWDALYELGAKDEAANSLKGDIRLIDANRNLIHSDGLRISVSGVNDLIIVASGNEIMILPRGSSQDAKKFSG